MNDPAMPTSELVTMLRREPATWRVSQPGPASRSKINPATMPGVHYTAADFTPIAMVGQLPFTLMVAKSVPAKDIYGLAELAKKEAGQLNGGQGGTTGTTYFLLEAFKKAGGIDVASIPYKGTSETVLDLLRILAKRQRVRAVTHKRLK